MVGAAFYRASGDGAYRGSGDARGPSVADDEGMITDEWNLEITTTDWEAYQQSGPVRYTFSPTVTIFWDGIEAMLNNILLGGETGEGSAILMRAVDPGCSFDKSDTQSSHAGWSLWNGGGGGRDFSWAGAGAGFSGTGPWYDETGINQGPSAAYHLSGPDIGGYVAYWGDRVLFGVALDADLTNSVYNIGGIQANYTLVLTKVSGGLVTQGAEECIEWGGLSVKSGRNTQPVDLAGFTGYAESDTWASHPGWQTHNISDAPVLVSRSQGVLNVKTELLIFNKPTWDIRGSSYRFVRSFVNRLVSASDFTSGTVAARAGIWTLTVNHTMKINTPTN